MVINRGWDSRDEQEGGSRRLLESVLCWNMCFFGQMMQMVVIWASAML